MIYPVVYIYLDQIICVFEVELMLNQTLLLCDSKCILGMGVVFVNFNSFFNISLTYRHTYAVIFFYSQMLLYHSECDTNAAEVHFAVRGLLLEKRNYI